MMQLDILGAAPPMKMSAYIVDCFRYTLTRIWDQSKPVLVACGVNPSDADAQKNDPTVRELVYFAKLWGYGGIMIVNFWAFRASKPKDMFAAADPLGPENVRYIDEAFALARSQNRPMLAIWGTNGAWRERDQWMIERARFHTVDLVCLGTTKDGFPKHPMARGVHRIDRNQQPVMFRRAAEAA